ncbi:MAG TPA: hypothetical protein VFV47_04530 [Hyphomicrobiaceae bacterium]|nr:hypothetical protein [Hyphomicrobiaceae bacterium]
MFGNSRQITSGGIPQKAPKRAWQHTRPDELFRTALREYQEATGSPRQAWLIEAVIRTGRGVATNMLPLDKGDREIVEAIKTRYRAFAKTDTLPAVVTYADAHAALKALFF